LIVTNYGSDIYWFRKFRGHRKKIEALLRISNFYSAECDRDVELAKVHGFNGFSLPVFPNAGGLTQVDLLSSPVISLRERSLIVVKGYHGWAGRALVAVRALVSLRGVLSDYRIVFYSTSLLVRAAVFLSPLKKISICFSKGALSHEQMMHLMLQARLYIGVSKTDGISTSALEALSRGAFPIQSSTSCLNEWIEDGFSGSLLPTFEHAEVARVIADSLELTSRISQADWVERVEPIVHRLDFRSVSNKARSFYRA
jgi:hypothetical protein